MTHGCYVARLLSFAKILCTGNVGDLREKDQVSRRPLVVWRKGMFGGTGFALLLDIQDDLDSEYDPSVKKHCASNPSFGKGNSLI